MFNSKTTRRIIASLLCLVMCMSLYLPTFAVDSTTISLQLSQTTFEVKEEEQTVTLSIVTSEEVSIDSLMYVIEVPQGWSVAQPTMPSSITGFTWSENMMIWYSSTTDMTGITNLGDAVVTIPATAAAGDYDIKVVGFDASANATYWVEQGEYTATLTINPATTPDEPVEPDPTPDSAGYTASVSSLETTVSVDGTVTVNVGVSHSSDATFAAGEVIVTYDNTLLEFDEAASTLGNATAKVANGTVTLEDYGTDKSFGTGVYVLKFKAIADGTANVVLTSAAFIDSEGAVSSDLIPAEITDSTVSVIIEKKAYSVTLPEIFEGATSIIDGANYTFSVADGKNYNYDNVTATINGVAVPVIDNGDGTYTIENVTGNVVITGTRTEKSYSVTFSGNAAGEITGAANSATYNTNYSFTIPSAQGWAYSVDSIIIGGTAYTGYSVSGSVYTIPGSAISGDIVITVSKTATEASVSVVGSGAGAAAGYTPTANMNQAYTLTIVPEVGYNYTVTATMGGVATTVTNNGNNTYTIASVTGDIVFTVEKIVIVDGVSVQRYLTLNGTNLWLVLNDATLADGKVATYDGNKMYWSETYGAYCYLIIAETTNADSVKNLIGITDGTAVSVDYGMDVNKTGKVDASDAQLTYNMYNAVYSAFDADATVEKFLRADVNGDKTVNVEDATAIIGSLLK